MAEITVKKAETPKQTSIPAEKIKLSSTATTLKNLKTGTTIKAVLTPANSTDTVSFQSLNTKIAVVTKEGKVVAKGPGTVKITAVSSSGKRASIKIHVLSPAASLKVKSKAVIKVKKSITIKATVKPSNTTDQITWSVKGKKLVKLSLSSNGKKCKIMGKKKGTVTINVKAGKKTAKVKVTVK